MDRSTQSGSKYRFHDCWMSTSNQFPLPISDLSQKMRISIFGWLPSQGIGGLRPWMPQLCLMPPNSPPGWRWVRKGRAWYWRWRWFLVVFSRLGFPQSAGVLPHYTDHCKPKPSFFFWFAILMVWKQNVKKWLLQNSEFVIIDCDFSVLSTLERSNQKRRRGNILCKSITVIEPDVEAIELLDHSSRSVQTLPLSSWADDLQLLPGRELLLEFLVHLLGQLGKVFRLVLDKAKGVLGERVKHVQAVDLISLQAKSITIFFLHRALQYYQYH